MFLPYFAGLFIGIIIGQGFERANNIYYNYNYTEKIIKLENKIKDYEHLFETIN